MSNDKKMEDVTDMPSKTEPKTKEAMHPDELHEHELDKISGGAGPQVELF